MTPARGATQAGDRHEKGSGLQNTTVGRDGSHKLAGTPEKYAGWTVEDPVGQKVGSVRMLFANGSGEPEYISVRLGVFGRCVLIPVQGVSVREDARTIVLQ